MVQKGLLNFFVANYFSQRRPRVSQPVNAGRHWRRKYCFASRSAHSYIFKSLWLWRVHKKTVIYDSVDEELQL